MTQKNQPKPIRLNLSEEEGSLRDTRIDFQERSIQPIIRFFVWANSLMLGSILAFALIEHFWPNSSSDIVVITDKVVIAAVGGIAIQSGAILIAAFKGLFSK